MTRLSFPDAESVADLATLAGRAHAIAPEGMVRLQGVGSVLACYAGVLDGTGLFGEGLVVGLRVLALAEPATVDVCVPSSMLAGLDEGSAVVDVEPHPVAPRWAAQAPPRAGWQAVATLDAAVVHEAARSRDVRRQAEGLPDGVTHGAALALRGLGLLTGDPVLHRNGPWRRLSTTAGHVLLR